VYSVQPLTITINGENYKAEFAKIDEVHLGFEDHGIYTVHIGWSMGSSHHGTGHLMLTHRDKDTGEHIINPRVGQFMIRMMQLFGNWDNIKGKECLALYPSEGHTFMNKAVGLAQLPTRGNKSFIFSDVLDV
jgi:hypothetical protein